MADAYKSLELARTAWAIATGGEAAYPNATLSRGVLRPGGTLLMKLLQGPGKLLANCSMHQAAVRHAAGSRGHTHELTCCQLPCLQARKSLRLSCGGTLQKWHGTGPRPRAAKAKRCSCWA